ncbi:hypothetical protein DIPPA_29444 [Diplonema papillatum]|nr:hypothetical protein DIPPA_29444 [Diplonema papillatum]
MRRHSPPMPDARIRSPASASRLARLDSEMEYVATHSSVPSRTATFRANATDPFMSLLAPRGCLMEERKRG